MNISCPNFGVDDIVISYELDSNDMPMIIVGVKSDDKLHILKCISGGHGAVSVNGLILDYLKNSWMKEKE